MENQNNIVDFIKSISTFDQIEPRAKGEQYVKVNFQGGKFGLLDKTTPQYSVWQNVLNSLYESQEPVYVEIDPATDLITEILIPLKVKVGEIKQIATEDVVDVELIISHARHYLRRANSNFKTLLEALTNAKEKKLTVLVIEKRDSHEIIDVRPFSNSNSHTLTTKMKSSDDNISVSITSVTLQKAYDLFNLVNSKICCPATAVSPCITFLFPDDGCWGRAHEMCRLMIGASVQPEKVWIYAFRGLRVKTQNHPRCEVQWGWHVAPILNVNTTSGSQVYVIDPSLFNNPVTQSTWVGVQGDPAATVVHSNASVFYRDISESIVEYDPDYTKTQQVLNRYRNELRLRSVSSSGPPPYINCITIPLGVQWLGTIEPNATKRWFTWGWPALWHIFWTIMPITPCPGNPQLSWTVQVQRANTTQCTYWITVRNLTSSTVRFEGRYDVLQR